MIKEEKKRPTIRFEGFEDDWEQRKLIDETIEIVAGGDIDKTKLVPSGKYPVIANALTADGIIGYYATDYRIKAPAVTVTGRGDVGHARARKISFTPVVRLLSITSNHNVDFLAEAINENDVILESTGVPQLTIPKLANYDIYFPPTLEEERIIGEYFNLFDSLITLHQRKLDQVKTLKKYFLQNMLPAKGDTVPKIRFKGFADEWEERKLGDIAEIGDIDHRMPKTVFSGIPYLMTGDFVGNNELNFDGVKEISETDYALLSRKIKPEKGDILFARYASVGAVRYIDFEKKFLVSYSCAIIKNNSKINSRFLYHFLTSDGAQQQIKLEINTGSQANIGIDSMKKHINILTTVDNEKDKIANFLTKLDNRITLHQRKVDQLQTLKKFMLQNLFV